MFYRHQCSDDTCERCNSKIKFGYTCEMCNRYICHDCALGILPNGKKGHLLCIECATKFEYLEHIKELKAKLKKEFSVNKEFSILNTKLEDLEIYLEAYILKLIKRGEDK